MKRMQVRQKLMYEKFYVHEIAAVNLSKIYFPKNAKKKCKPNKRDLNPDWTTENMWFLYLVEINLVLITRRVR